MFRVNILYEGYEKKAFFIPPIDRRMDQKGDRFLLISKSHNVHLFLLSSYLTPAICYAMSAGPY